MATETAETTLTEGGVDSAKRLKVLLVEDFKTMRKAIIRILHEIDLDVVEAGNGIEALKVLDQEQVDIVFTDLVMPEMDGFELCEEIRRRPDTRHLPVVVVSTTDTNPANIDYLIPANDTSRRIAPQCR